MTYAVFSVLAMALLALDQWVKFWTTANLGLGESAPLLPGFVELLSVHNYGAAWSSFSGQRWLLLGVTCCIMVFVTVLLARRIVRHGVGLAACFLILSGGIGNIIDRVRLGFVVDFIYWHGGFTWPNFNLADSFICVGAGLMILLSFRHEGARASATTAKSETTAS